MPIDGSGEIQLSDIYNEFTGTHSSQEIQLSDYHDEGNAPASGEIQLAADFYGTSSAYDPPWQGNTGFFFGGQRYGNTNANPPHVVRNAVHQHSISSNANAWADAGDLNENRTRTKAGSNGTRIVVGGGVETTNGWQWTPHISMDYTSFASPASTWSDFGDFVAGDESGGVYWKAYPTVHSNGTVAVWTGGGGWNGDAIETITVSTTGNATDSGDMAYKGWNAAGSSGSTRAIYKKGGTWWSTEIEYFAFSSVTSWSDFGDMASSYKNGRHECIEDDTRAWFMGRYNSSGYSTSEIDYITVASTGDSSSWGDLRLNSGGTVPRSDCATMANGTRAVVHGGFSSNTGQTIGNITSTMHNFTLASTGNALDDFAQTIEALVEHGGASGT